MRRVLAVVVALVLPGCAGTPSGTPPAHADRHAVLLCDGGQRLEVAFEDRAATFTTDGKTVRMLQQPAASGVWYSGDGHTLRGKGADLTLTNDRGEQRACRDQELATRQPQIQPPVTGLAGTSWRLVKFQSSADEIGTVIPPRLETYVLTFGRDGAYSAQLDCNRAKGTWQSRPDGSLTMTGGAMTRAMCGPGAIDSQVARDLGFVRSYILRDGKLHMALKLDSGIYTWEPAEAGK